MTTPDMEMVVKPVSLAPRNYHSWLKLFDKNTHFCSKSELFGKIHETLIQESFLSVPAVFKKGFKGVLGLIFS